MSALTPGNEPPCAHLGLTARASGLDAFPGLHGPHAEPIPPFRPQPQDGPSGRQFPWPPEILGTNTEILASPFPSRLAGCIPPKRVRFLRTGGSLSIAALHGITAAHLCKVSGWGRLMRNESSLVLRTVVRTRGTACRAYPTWLVTPKSSSEARLAPTKNARSR